MIPAAHTAMGCGNEKAPNLPDLEPFLLIKPSTMEKFAWRPHRGARPGVIHATFRLSSGTSQAGKHLLWRQ